MADFNFEELLEGYLPEDPTKGEEREVTIVKKEMIFTYLDINGKLEGRVRTEEVTEIPLSFSISIQSETACLAVFLPFTEPARLIAPP